MTQAPGSTVGPQSPIGPIGAFLERFRRTPGMPARVGDETAVELAPVFAALDVLEREAQALRDGSERMAAQRLHKAREAAAALVVEAGSAKRASRRSPTTAPWPWRERAGFASAPSTAPAPQRQRSSGGT